MYHQKKLFHQIRTEIVEILDFPRNWSFSYKLLTSAKFGGWTFLKGFIFTNLCTKFQVNRLSISRVGHFYSPQLKCTGTRTPTKIQVKF